MKLYSPSKTGYVLAILFFIAAFWAIWQGASYDKGWGGDYGGYLTQARAIRTGTCVQPYYQYNEQLPYLAPPYYPMGYPLLLAAFYQGIDNNALIFYTHLNDVLWWLTGVMLFLILVSRFDTILSLIIAAFWLFNPNFFSFKNGLYPDVLCVLSLLIAILAYLFSDHRKWYSALICGFVAGWAWLTRANGVVFLLAIPVHQIWEYWKPGRHKENARQAIRPEIVFTAIVIGVAVLMNVGVRYAFTYPATSGSYFDQLTFAHFSDQMDEQLNEFIRETLYYFQIQKNSVYTFGHAKADQFAALGGVLLIGFMLMGIRHPASKEDRFLLVFGTVMTVLLMIWPMAQGMRYSMPILAVSMYFIAKGLETYMPRGWVGTGLKLLIIPLFFWSTCSRLDKSVVEISKEEDVGSPQHRANQEAYAYCRNNLPEDALVGSHSPLVFGLYAQRKAIQWPEKNAAEIQATFIKKDVGYLLYNNWSADHDQGIRDYVRENHSNLDTIWKNERNTLIRLKR